MAIASHALLYCVDFPWSLDDLIPVFFSRARRALPLNSRHASFLFFRSSSSCSITVKKLMFGASSQLKSLRSFIENPIFLLYYHAQLRILSMLAFFILLFAGAVVLSSPTHLIELAVASVFERELVLLQRRVVWVLWYDVATPIVYNQKMPPFEEVRHAEITM